jgi:hypothetical protein
MSGHRPEPPDTAWALLELPVDTEVVGVCSVVEEELDDVDDELDVAALVVVDTVVVVVVAEPVVAPLAVA